MTRYHLQAARCLAAAVLSVFGACAGIQRAGEPSPAEPEIARLLSGLDLRQRIGQRFIGWVPREGFAGEAEALAEAGEIGGFIIYPWNYSTIEDVRELTAAMQGAAAKSGTGVPLFIAADQEGGRVAAFRFPELVRLPAPFHLAANLPPEAVEAAAYVNAVQLRSLGVNMNLAPVLDLYPVADETLIGDRAFGADANAVAAAGTAFVRGTIRGGVLPVVKHFPGHGISTVDSHGALPVVRGVDAREFERHLAPFRSAIENGAPAIMPAHILYPDLDPNYPVTLSDIFMRKILREELRFTGLVVSDGLSMGALSRNYSLEETLGRCFQSGIDMILVHSGYSVAGLIDMVVSLVESGAVTESQIDEGLVRVLVAKRNTGVLATGAAETARAGSSEGAG